MRTIVVSGILSLVSVLAGAAQPPAAPSSKMTAGQSASLHKVAIHEFAYPDVSARGIGERNTVSNGPDDGANNLMASHFWNVKRHGSTTQAVDNALIPVAVTIAPDPRPSMTSAGGLNVGGHGNEGLLETGMGQHGPFNTGQIIYLWNEGSWGPQLDRVVPTPITMMSIWSCHTGAGQDGADLLYAMARRVGRAVRGRTGFTYNNQQQTWFENGSVWQVATPDHKPDPIQSPTPHSLTQEVAMFQGAKRLYSSTDATRMVVRQLSLGGQEVLRRTLTSTDAQTALTVLFLAPALDLRDTDVLAMVTAAIEITFASGETVTFEVYNDRLAKDSKSATGYYLSGGLRTLVQGG